MIYTALGQAWNTKDNFPTQSTQQMTDVNVNIVEMVNTCCTHSSISRYRFPSFPPPGSKPYLRAGWRQWREAWRHTTGNRLWQELSHDTGSGALPTPHPGPWWLWLDGGLFAVPTPRSWSSDQEAGPITDTQWQIPDQPCHSPDNLL